MFVKGKFQIAPLVHSSTELERAAFFKMIMIPKPGGGFMTLRMDGGLPPGSQKGTLF